MVNILTFFISTEFIFFQTRESLLTYPWSDPGTGSQSKLFFAVAAIISLLPLFTKINLRFPEKLKLSPLVRNVLLSAFSAILAALIITGRFDRKTAAYFHVEKLFSNGRFKEVTDWNLAHPPTNLLTIFLNNIALCETDRLNDMLFNFPQSNDGSTLFLNGK